MPPQAKTSPTARLIAGSGRAMSASPPTDRFSSLIGMTLASAATEWGMLRRGGSTGSRRRARRGRCPSTTFRQSLAPSRPWRARIFPREPPRLSGSRRSPKQLPRSSRRPSIAPMTAATPRGWPGRWGGFPGRGPQLWHSCLGRRMRTIGSSACGWPVWPTSTRLARLKNSQPIPRRRSAARWRWGCVASLGHGPMPSGPSSPRGTRPAIAGSSRGWASRPRARATRASGTAASPLGWRWSVTAGRPPPGARSCGGAGPRCRQS